MPPSPDIEERPGDVLSIAVIGNDTVLAALPAHPIQLAHGCHLLGYHTVVPASWGDELIADAILREAKHRGRRPAIVCACERARARLTTGAGELLPFLISTIAPPVAAARYLRTVLAERRLDITFVGDCLSGGDPVFDARYSPDVFLVRLRSSGIDLRELPTHFENLMPPDRRRYASLPGGCPTTEALARRCPDRQLIELTDSNLAIELAQQLFAQEAVLLDIAAGVGCSCAGVRVTGSARTARVAVTSLEPPRSLESVVDGEMLIDVSFSSPPPMWLALLARDPNADMVQSVLPASKAADPVLPPVTHDRDVAADAPQLPTSEATPSHNMKTPAAVLSKRPFAITPPHALRAVGASRRTSPAEPDPSPLHASRGSRSVEVDEELVPPAVPHAGALPDPPSIPHEATPTRAAAAGAVPLPFLVEDPVVAAHRAAHARIRAAVRRVPPAPHDRIRSMALWGTVIIAAISCIVAIVARSR